MRTRADYRWDDVNDDDDKDRPRMADDDGIGSQALTGGDITTCHKTVQTSSSHR